MPPLPYRHRFVSALLALLVLASSVGVTAERHRCRISGRSTVALRLPGLPGFDSHAASKARPCGKRRSAGCCDISHAQHKLDAASATGAAKWLAGAPAWLPALPPASAPTWPGRAAPAPVAPAVLVGAAANGSPPGVPRAGRVLLARLCTLVV